MGHCATALCATSIARPEASLKNRFFVIDYIEQGLHTTEVTRSVTQEFVEVSGAGWLPRLSEKLSLALLALALFPPFRWFMMLCGPKRDLFALIMKGPTYLVYNAPFFLLGRGKRSAWITDTWPNRDRRLIFLARVLRLNPIFVSYQESAERLKKLAPHIHWIYVPEALPRDDYPSRPQDERDWDVITFGRKYMAHHTALKAENTDGHIRYRFRDDGIHVAKTHRDLLEALGDARVSICVPRGVTHDHAGGVTAMTMRYLQSIACGCLVMGETPSEMRDLFGYDPVIKADLEHPVQQLDALFGDWAPFQALIDRNRAVMLKYHVWNRRARYITAVLRDRFGFEIEASEVRREDGLAPVDPVEEM